MAQFNDVHTLEIEARINEKTVRREVYPLPDGTRGRYFEDLIVDGPHNGKESFIRDLIYELRSKGKAVRDVPGEATFLKYTWKVKSTVIQSK